MQPLSWDSAIVTVKPRRPELDPAVTTTRELFRFSATWLPSGKQAGREDCVRMNIRTAHLFLPGRK